MYVNGALFILRKYISAELEYLGSLLVTQLVDRDHNGVKSFVSLDKTQL